MGYGYTFIVMRMAGFEPAVFRMVACRACQFRHIRIMVRFPHQGKTDAGMPGYSVRLAMAVAWV